MFMNEKVGSIYCIYWWDLDIAYVGQTSVKLDHRIQQHISSLAKNTHYNSKVQEAYNVSKNYSVLLLETSFISELDAAEMFWISELDATNPIKGANKTFGGGSAGKGLQHARSKYSKSTVLKIFSLLLKKYSVLEIIDRLKLSTNGIVYSIKNGASHRWLKEEYPEKYSVLESKEFKAAHRAKGDKISRYSTGTPHPDFIDENGNIYTGITNLRDFCRNHPKLSKNYEGNASALASVLQNNGRNFSVKGFKLLQK